MNAKRLTKYFGKWFYMHGGNPSTAAGIFDENGNRLAWWPAACAPTQERFEIAYRLIIAREDDKPVTRGALQRAFIQAGKLEDD